MTAQLTGSDPRPVLVQALPPADGWFRASIERGAPAGTSLQIELGSGAPDTGPRTPTIPLDVELHAFLDSGVYICIPFTAAWPVDAN